MAKITLPTISSGYATTTQLNNAFDALETELQNKVLYRDNPSGEPNVMEQDLDMNSNKIINVSDVEVGGVNILTTMQDIYDDYEALTNRVTISTSSPTGGTDGDIWFKVSV
jgi:hypothetical protein